MWSFLTICGAIRGQERPHMDRIVIELLECPFTTTCEEDQICMLIEDKVEGLQGNLMKVCSTPRDCYSMRTASFDQCETSNSAYRTEFKAETGLHYR